MDAYIKSQAENLAKVSKIDNQFKTQDLKDKIKRFLSQFYSGDDRTDFLNYYKSLMDELLGDHLAKCQKRTAFTR